MDVIGGSGSADSDIIVYCCGSRRVRLRVNDDGDCSCSNNRLKLTLLPGHVAFRLGSTW